MLDNRDLAGLARCLPPDSGSRSPNGGGGGSGSSGHQSPVGGAAIAAGVAGDGRGGAGDAQQQRERLRPDLLPLNVNDMNSGYYAGRTGSGGGGGDVGEHTLPLDSPSNNSLFSFGSSTSMAEEDEVGRGFGFRAHVDRRTRIFVRLLVGEAHVAPCVVKLTSRAPVFFCSLAVVDACHSIVFYHGMVCVPRVLFSLLRASLEVVILRTIPGIKNETQISHLLPAPKKR